MVFIFSFSNKNLLIICEMIRQRLRTVKIEKRRTASADSNPNKKVGAGPHSLTPNPVPSFSTGTRMNPVSYTNSALPHKGIRTV